MRSSQAAPQRSWQPHRCCSTHLRRRAHAWSSTGNKSSPPWCLCAQQVRATDATSAWLYLALIACCMLRGRRRCLPLWSWLLQRCVVMLWRLRQVYTDCRASKGESGCR